ncbi:MAG: serine hydroxymethyltransferase, partial [bacterium]
FVVCCEEHGYTESHQVAVDVRDHEGGRVQAQRLEDAGVVCNMNMLPGDTNPMRPSGLRLGTQELVRIGLGPGDMEDVATFYARVVLKGEEPAKVASSVAAFREDFQKVHYCFGPERGAYEFWDLVGEERG